MMYTNYQEQAKTLARLAVEILTESTVDTAHTELMCRALHKYGYINMENERYVLEFIPNGRVNAKKRMTNKKPTNRTNCGAKMEEK